MEISSLDLNIPLLMAIGSGMLMPQVLPEGAMDLKHLTDRLKHSGSSAESTGLYFKAALKFLHGASLLESNNGESVKQSGMIQSMQMYSSTAKLCENGPTYSDILKVVMGHYSPFSVYHTLENHIPPQGGNNFNFQSE
ncbi:hypothetical protein Vadar_004281 [Vaccinium darrowii]|uniref:Uncharacterized protein n=1 Tax=Vaccinium darrowii TaxID=229202 RepID=A0ACB7XN65_9ERIC|nr:hypothetical protein Vadar_004281 [Vaccinium darrowii]